MPTGELAVVDSSGRHDIRTAAKLALDLLASPASRVDGPGCELAVRTSVLNHRRNPVLAESLDQLSLRVGVRKVTNDTHGCPHQRLAPVHVVGNDVEQLENRFDIWLENLSYRKGLISVMVYSFQRDQEL